MNIENNGGIEGTDYGSPNLSARGQGKDPSMSLVSPGTSSVDVGCPWWVTHMVEPRDTGIT